MFKSFYRWRFWRDVKRNADQRGWTIVFLDDRRGGPVWGYTVGLWQHRDAPELIMFGHDEQWTLGVLSQAVKQIHEGLKPFDDMTWELEGFIAVWRKVEPIHIQYEEWFTCARRYRRERGDREEFEAFQIVVPDRSGKYPWDEGFDENIRRMQQELYRAAPALGPGELAMRSRL